jgi:cobalt-zinc-cadmium efflux system protein
MSHSNIVHHPAGHNILIRIDIEMESHDHSHSYSHGSKRLVIALVITALYMFAEIAGGLWFNSLALLADAGHMLSDVMALTLSWVAILIGRRKPSDTHTFGFRRSEILAALINGLALWVIVALIFFEAAKRFFAPEQVQAGGMLIVAGIGLAVNLGMAAMLFSSKDENLNLKSAFTHIIGDALGSLGAIVAAVVILFTGMNWFDPLVSIFVGLLILFSSWGFVKQAVRILMEGVPPDLNIGDVEKAILDQAGVCCVHDLHIWSISGRHSALAAHLVIPDPAVNRDRIIEAINLKLREFGIDHTTLQIESSHDALEKGHAATCRPGTMCSTM